MTVIETALNLARIGLRVIPARGKTGIAGTYQRATIDEAQIIEWWDGPYKHFNLAAILDDTILAVDRDTKKDGPKNWLEIVNGHDMPPTLEVETPTGGAHSYFRIEGGAQVRGRVSLLAPGVDIWCGERLLLMPPSLHPDTRTEYRFKGEAPDWSRGAELIPSVPAWLLKRITDAERLPAAIRPGGRHQALLVYALKARIQNGLDLDELFGAIKLYRDYRDFDKSDDEIWRVARDTVLKFDFKPTGKDLRVRQRLDKAAEIDKSFRNAWGRI
jgi:hypothetical protein